MAEYIDADAIELNSTTSGSISPTGDSDAYKFTITEAGVITLFTTGEVDVYGTLKEVTQTTPTVVTRTVTSDFDSGTGTNFRISIHLNIGEYFIDIRTDTGAVGDYILVSQFRADSATSTTTQTYEEVLQRPAGKVLPFAVNATISRTKFGTTTQTTDSIDDNLNAGYKSGWNPTGTATVPTVADFNAMGYTTGYLIAYLYEQGIPHITNATYPLNSIVKVSANNTNYIYRAKITGATNNVSNTTYWEKILIPKKDVTVTEKKLECFSMFYARNSTQEASDKILKTSFRPRAFQVEEASYPNSSMVELSTGYFIAPEDGTYYFNATITFDGSSITNLKVNADGSTAYNTLTQLLCFIQSPNNMRFKAPIRQQLLNAPDGREYTTSISALLKLSAGDKIRVGQVLPSVTFKDMDNNEALVTKINIETYFGIKYIRFNGYKIL